MMSKTNVCINHPETVAKRRCYHCLSPICPQCQRKALGHIYCSSRCQVLSWFGDKAIEIRRFALRISLRYRRFEKSTQRFTGGGFFRLLSLGLLLFLLYQTTVLVDTIGEISLSHPAAPLLPSLPETEIAYEGDWITVAGSAPDFAVAVLLADGREKDMVPVSEGRYSFTFKADKNIKSFQIQVYGDRLPTMYTRAIPVPESVTGVKRKPEEIAEPEKVSTPAPDRKAAVEPPSGKVSAARKDPPRIPKPLDDLSRGSPATGTVAITFDGGSYSNAAVRILDVLAKRDLKATFFLTGEFINRYPGITRKIVEGGHEVGNHMYSHLHLTTYGKNYRQETLPGVDRTLVQKELLRNEEAFEDATGRKMVKLWRAPYGEQNEEIRQWALKAGYRHVSWTYDPKTKRSLDGLDWVSDQDSALYLSSNQIIQKIISFDSETEMGLAGGIILLHLGSERDADPFHLKLGELIDRLQEKGYKVGSVSDMLKMGG